MMFRPNLLLKIISFYLIIANIVGLIVLGVICVMIVDGTTAPQIDMGPLAAALPVWHRVLAAINCCVAVVTGSMGVSGKSIKWATVFIVIYTCIQTIFIISFVVEGVFSLQDLSDYIVPALYIGGLYMSKKEKADEQ